MCVRVQYHAFSFINSIIQSTGCREGEKQQLQEEALRNLEELVSIDCRQAASTVMTSLASSLRTVIAKLRNKDSVLFDFLQGVMAYRWASGNILSNSSSLLSSCRILLPHGLQVGFWQYLV